MNSARRGRYLATRRLSFGLQALPAMPTRFAAFIICLAIAVAVFEIARGAWDRRRIKVRRKG